MSIGLRSIFVIGLLLATLHGLEQNPDLVTQQKSPWRAGFAKPLGQMQKMGMRQDLELQFESCSTDTDASPPSAQETIADGTANPKKVTSAHSPLPSCQILTVHSRTLKQDLTPQQQWILDHQPFQLKLEYPGSQYHITKLSSAPETLFLSRSLVLGSWKIQPLFPASQASTQASPLLLHLRAYSPMSSLNSSEIHRFETSRAFYLPTDNAEPLAFQSKQQDSEESLSAKVFF